MLYTTVVLASRCFPAIIRHSCHSCFPAIMCQSIRYHSFQLFSRHIVPRPSGIAGCSCFPALLFYFHQALQLPFVSHLVDLRPLGVTASSCFSAILWRVHQASQVPFCCYTSIRRHNFQLLSCRNIFPLCRLNFPCSSQLFAACYTFIFFSSSFFLIISYLYFVVFFQSPQFP